jgi:hypothetical protein
MTASAYLTDFEGIVIVVTRRRQRIEHKVDAVIADISRQFVLIAAHKFVHIVPVVAVSWGK